MALLGIGALLVSMIGFSWANRYWQLHEQTHRISSFIAIRTGVGVCVLSLILIVSGVSWNYFLSHPDVWKGVALVSLGFLGLYLFVTSLNTLSIFISLLGQASSLAVGFGVGVFVVGESPSLPKWSAAVLLTGMQIALFFHHRKIQGRFSRAFTWRPWLAGICFGIYYPLAAQPISSIGRLPFLWITELPQGVLSISMAYFVEKTRLSTLPPSFVKNAIRQGSLSLSAQFLYFLALLWTPITTLVLLGSLSHVINYAFLENSQSVSRYKNAFVLILIGALGALLTWLD